MPINKKWDTSAFCGDKLDRKKIAKRKGEKYLIFKWRNKTYRTCKMRGQICKQT
jgi:hypothetical protein